MIVFQNGVKTRSMLAKASHHGIEAGQVLGYLHSLSSNVLAQLKHVFLSIAVIWHSQHLMPLCTCSGPSAIMQHCKSPAGMQAHMCSPVIILLL